MMKLINENYSKVESLRDSIKDCRNVAANFVICIREGAWKTYTTRLGKEITHNNFIEFIKAKYPRGLDTTPENLRHLISYDYEALDIFDKLSTRKPGGDNGNQYTGGKSYNITLAKTGTSLQYALRKLRNDAPKLHKQVLEGRLSANKAMIEAGFRKAEKPLEIIKKNIKKLNKVELKEVSNLIEKNLGTF